MTDWPTITVSRPEGLTIDQPGFLGIWDDLDSIFLREGRTPPEWADGDYYLIPKDKVRGQKWWWCDTHDAPWIEGELACVMSEGYPACRDYSVVLIVEDKR